MIQRSIIFDSASNFGIFKTETIYNFGSHKNRLNNSAEPSWTYNGENFARSLTDKSQPTSETKNFQKSIGRKHKIKKHGKHKIIKCLHKFLKGKRKKHKIFKLKKLMISLFMGILLVKSLIIPIAFKTLALVVVKGIIMGFISAILSSVMSLKGVLGHPYGHRNRKYDGKTRVEITHLPGKHDVYYERPLRRDYVTSSLIKKV